MNTAPTYRRGRRIHIPGERKSSSCDDFLSSLSVFLLITIPLLIFYFVEQHRFNVYTSLAETIDRDILDLASLPSNYKQHPSFNDKINNSIVHGKPTKINSATVDHEMGIRINDSLHLSRQTEYCQWEEIRGESCQTCTRTKHNENGESYTESYECNCVKTFDYIKGWRTHRIQSLYFDQPAAHYNPQRDPLPRKTFVSDDVILEFLNKKDSENTTEIKDTREEYAPLIATLSPSMIQNGIRGAKARTIKWVRGGIPPITSFWTRWIPDRTRYEDSYHLYQHPLSNYALASNFVYVGDGWFFSPYEASRLENIFKFFMEYIEGSMFDWQVGDLMPNCEAGDIRIRYKVQDPQDVSILGQLAANEVRDNKSSEARCVIEPIQTKNGRSVGLVHQGFHSAQEMIIIEDQDSIVMAAICRCLFLLWAFGICRHVGLKMFGIDLSTARAPTQIASTFGIWSAVYGSFWIWFWGVQVDGIILIIASALFAKFFHRFPPPTKAIRGKYKRKTE